MGTLGLPSRAHEWLLMRRLSVPALVLGLLAGPLVVAAPAQSAPAKAVVSASPSVSEAKVSTPLKVKGRVKGRSAKAVVVLQRKKASRWVRVSTSRVTPKKRYTLAAKVRGGATTYRVKVRKNQRIKAARSRTFTVVGTPRNGDTTSSSAERAAINQILAETNAFRAAHGKPALKLSTEMTTVARNWSQRMATTGEFKHNPDYAKQIPAGWTRAGENIAAGYALNSVVQGWIDSPGHRANLLGDFTHLGIGYVSQPGTRYTRYYTQVFAKY